MPSRKDTVMNTVITDKKAAAEYVAEIDRKAEELKNIIIMAHDTVRPVGTKYYVSENGDDANDGISPETPVKTFDGVAKLPLVSGDAVLFKRGETFRGCLTAKTGITYSAYGEGKKPLLTNSLRNYADPAIWEETDTPNVYKLTIPLTNDAGIAVFDDTLWSEKRIKGRPEFPEGKLSDLDCDLAMWHDVPLPMKETGYVYLRSDKGNPGERFKSIEIGTRMNIVRVPGVNDVIFDNLCFKYGGAHGIGTGHIMGLTVQYCEFGFIGGSWFRTDILSRYGNAIEIYGGARDYKVRYNYIYQIYDAGITHQYKNGPDAVVMADIEYSHNLVEDTSYSIEYFLTEAVDVEIKPERYMKDISMHDNILRRCGMGFGDQRPDKSRAAHIKGWHHTNKAWNYSIRDNIFCGSKYMLLHVGDENDAWLPEMSGNTYVQEKGKNFGIFGMDEVVHLVDGNIGKLLDETVHEKDGIMIVL